jgi:hypothetical protein
MKMPETAMTRYEQMLREAVAEAVTRGADIAYDRHGTQSAEDTRVWMRVRDTETSRLYVERMSHWSEGFRIRTRSFDRLSSGALRTFQRIVREEISAVERLQARDRASIEACGDRYRPAPDSFRAHRIGILLARHMALTPEEVCRIPLERAEPGWRPPQDRETLTPTDLQRGGWKAIFACHADRVLFQAIGCQGLTFADADSIGARLSVEATLPETAMAAIPGQDLGKIVSHPAFPAETGVIVRRAEQTSGLAGARQIVLYLSRVDDPITNPGRTVP